MTAKAGGAVPLVDHMRPAQSRAVKDVRFDRSRHRLPYYRRSLYFSARPSRRGPAAAKAGVRSGKFAATQQTLKVGNFCIPHCKKPSAQGAQPKFSLFFLLYKPETAYVDLWANQLPGGVLLKRVDVAKSAPRQRAALRS
jgi:hypothetical protein